MWCVRSIASLLAKASCRFDVSLVGHLSGGEIESLTLAEGFAQLGGGFEELDDGLALLLGGRLRFGQQRDADLLLDGRRPGGEDSVDGIADTLHA